MKLNRVFRAIGKTDFHIPNWRWLKRLVGKLFRVRAYRGRGPRKEVAQATGIYISRLRQDLPVRYAKRLHVYLR